MSKKKKSLFPHYKNPVYFILFWTIFLGVVAGILVTIIGVIISAIGNDWDWRLAPFAILSAAFSFALIGLIASSVYVLIMRITNRRNGSG